MANFTLNVPNPAQNVLQGIQTFQGIRASEQAQAQAVAEQARQQQIGLAMEELRNNPNPTAQDYVKVASMLPPDQAKSLLANWDTLSKEQQENRLKSGIETLAAFRISPEAGIESLRRSAEAHRNKGNIQDAEASERLAKWAELDPEFATSTMGATLAGIPGGKEALESVFKIDEAKRKEQLQPLVIKKKAADVGLTDAQTNEVIMNTKKIAADIRKTNIEADKVATEAAVKALDLLKGTPDDIELGKDARALINESVANAANFRSLSTQYKSLADAISADLASGVAGRIQESGKKFFGSEDQITRARQEYRRLRNSQVLNMLPPGVASDRDIQIAMEAFPSDTASPDIIASFLRGMSKLQLYDAEMNDLKAEWVNGVGSLGKARDTVTVKDKSYPRGTNFNDMLEDQLKIPSLLEAGEAPSATPTTRPQAQQIGRFQIEVVE